MLEQFFRLVTGNGSTATAIDMPLFEAINRQNSDQVHVPEVVPEPNYSMKPTALTEMPSECLPRYLATAYLYLVGC